MYGKHRWGVLRLKVPGNVKKAEHTTNYLHMTDQVAQEYKVERLWKADDAALEESVLQNR